MSEIKFRAYDTHNRKGKIGKVVEINFSTGECILGFGDPEEENPEGWGGYAISGYLLSEVDLMQFTGLQDKNGKDIYEGDIVRLQKWPSSPFEVKWCNGKGEMLGNQLGWILDDSQFCSGEHLVPLEAYLHWSEPSKEEYGDMEVIGNIYENPELVAPINN